MTATLPAPVSDALAVWLTHHDRIAAGLIEGLYVVGSVALDDWRPGSDIDVVACTADPATDDDAELLRAAFEATVADLEGAALEVTIDGPILAWGDLTTAPLAAMRPWTLDGAFAHDGDCFEINPVTWYTLAEHGIAVRGDAPARLDVYVDDDDRHNWVRGNVHTYWRSVRDQVGEALEADPDRTEFSAPMTEWCVLGVARMLFTIETGAVASKSAAGEWAQARFAAHAAVIDHARRLRHGLASGPVHRTTVTAVVEWMTAAIDAA